MCDPISATLVATGLGASGWATNNMTKSANRNMQAMQTAKEGAYNRSMDRQDEFANRAGQAFGSNVKTSGRESFDDLAAQNADKRLQAFTGSRMGDGTYDVAASTPKNVMMAKEKAFGEAAQKVADRDKVLSTLSGYGDAAFNQGLSRNAFGRAFGNIADEAGGDMALLPLEMQQAQNRAFKAPNSALGLAKQAGKLAVMGGSSGMFGGAGGAGGAGGLPPGAKDLGTDMPWLKQGYNIRGY